MELGVVLNVWWNAVAVSGGGGGGCGCGLFLSSDYSWGTFG